MSNNMTRTTISPMPFKPLARPLDAPLAVASKGGVAIGYFTGFMPRSGELVKVQVWESKHNPAELIAVRRVNGRNRWYAIDKADYEAQWNAYVERVQNT